MIREIHHALFIYESTIILFTFSLLFSFVLTAFQIEVVSPNNVGQTFLSCDGMSSSWDDSLSWLFSSTNNSCSQMALNSSEIGHAESSGSDDSEFSEFSIESGNMGPARLSERDWEKRTFL